MSQTADCVIEVQDHKISISVFFFLKFSTCCRNTSLDYTIQTKSYYFTIMCSKLRKWPNTVGGRRGKDDRNLNPLASLKKPKQGLRFHSLFDLPSSYFYGFQPEIKWISNLTLRVNFLLKVTSFHGVAGGAVSRWELEMGKPVMKEWLRYFLSPATVSKPYTTEF